MQRGSSSESIALAVLPVGVAVFGSLVGFEEIAVLLAALLERSCLLGLWIPASGIQPTKADKP
jgi:hypothetical protein